jgi:hypothetical protein
LRAVPVAVAFSLSRAFFFRCRSARQRLIGLEPRPIDARLYLPGSRGCDGTPPGAGYGTPMPVRAPKRPREKRPLPPPLPPERRTIGQLVAEAIHLYERNFWRALALGVGPAATVAAGWEVGFHPGLVFVVAAWVIVCGASLAGACLLVVDEQPPREMLVRGFTVGVVVALPWALLATFALVPGVLWLGLVGLSVPAAVVERLPVWRSLARGFELARTDLLHALGSIATLQLVIFLTQILLFVLLNSASDQATAISGFLASLVLLPLLFLGNAILYGDQSARAAVKSSRSR